MIYSFEMKEKKRKIASGLIWFVNWLERCCFFKRTDKRRPSKMLLLSVPGNNSVFWLRFDGQPDTKTIRPRPVNESTSPSKINRCISDVETTFDKRGSRPADLSISIRIVVGDGYRRRFLSFSYFAKRRRRVCQFRFRLFAFPLWLSIRCPFPAKDLDVATK